MSLIATALVTLVEAKQQLRQPTDDRNQVIERIVNAATGYVERKIDRPVVVRAVTDELVDGSGTNELTLSKCPIASVTAVSYLSGVSPEAWTALDLTASGYPPVIVGPGKSRFMLRAYWFPCGRQNVKVSYAAGYSTVPDELKEAGLQVVKALYRQFEKAPDDAQSVSFAGNAVTVELDRTLPKQTLDILAMYRRRAA